MKEPNRLIWNERLDEADKKFVEELNASLGRLNCARAIEINVSGLFARSKIAWKLAAYQHVLLHRIVALMDGAAVAWNNHCTLSAFLSARALVETVIVIADLDERVVRLLEQEDLGRLDALAQNGIFANRDVELISKRPETKATNITTYVEKFDKRFPGFKGHYDMLSERCHPNALGHNFMFAKLDHTNGTIQFCDERDPRANAQTVLAALSLLPLVESVTLIDKWHGFLIAIWRWFGDVNSVGSCESQEKCIARKRLRYKAKMRFLTLARAKECSNTTAFLITRPCEPTWARWLAGSALGLVRLACVSRRPLSQKTREKTRLLCRFPS